MNKVISSFEESSVAFSEQVNAIASRHLLRQDGQEDLAFGLWYPSEGKRRLTALVHEIMLPEEGDRQVHGNVSFNPQYFTRAIRRALEIQAGVILMHSHLGPGWQGMSDADIRAESGNAGAVLSATGLPLVGATLGTDGSWSGRFWRRTGFRDFQIAWSSNIRVVGHRLRVTFHPTLRPMPLVADEQLRSAGVWGDAGHGLINNLRIGVIGLGSVGSLVAEAAARQGVQDLMLMDFDRIKAINRDRTAGATRSSIGRLKVHVARDHVQRSTTARLERLHVEPVVASVGEPEGFRNAIDCDVLFSCVDRPWARQVLNQIAYAHLIPVINGGILVRKRGDRVVGADWHVHTVAPERRCMECWKAYDPADVGLEQLGLLDEPSYIKQLDPSHPLLRHENVFPFSMNVAALEFQQMAAMIIGDIPNVGDQNGHFVGGGFDRTPDLRCEQNCLYAARVGTGDTRRILTGTDLQAAKVGRVERRRPKT